MNGLGVGAVVFGACIVAAAKPVPERIRHDVHVRVDGTVTVRMPDLDEFKPGQVIPDTVDVRLPDGIVVRVPVTVAGTPGVLVPTDYTVSQR